LTEQNLDVDCASAILTEGVRLGASDIHLDPMSGAFRVRMRVDGRFIDRPPVEGEDATRLIGRLKVLARLMVYRSDVPQEGRIKLEDGHEGRLAVIPSVGGEKATIRLFPVVGSRDTVESLGLIGRHTDWLKRMLSLEAGLVLVVGPSGSGKTTTLYAMVRDLLAQRGDFCQVCTIEDPVEREIQGATQVEVDRLRDLGFAEGLKFILRQDPEVVMVGEIRDAETARVAVRAAMTGHLVISTLHCGRAIQGRPRLLEMGVPEYAVKIGLAGVIAQRLLRKLCDACNGGGCAACLQTGFHGRCLVSECANGQGERPEPTMEEVADGFASSGVVPEAEVARVFGGRV
jgi:general secretion pathway protein E